MQGLSDDSRARFSTPDSAAARGAKVTKKSQNPTWRVTGT